VPRPQGIDRLVSLCSDHHQAPLATAVNGIVGCIAPQDAPTFDDLLLLGIEV